MEFSTHHLRVSQLLIFFFSILVFISSLALEISNRRDKRMHPRFLSLFQCARWNAFLFPPRSSEYFEKSFWSCTFNYTVIQMASFTWYFFGRVGRIENSMGVSPFVFIGRGKNLEFTRERVFFFFSLSLLFLCLLLLRDIIDFFSFFRFFFLFFIFVCVIDPRCCTI